MKRDRSSDQDAPPSAPGMKTPSSSAVTLEDSEGYLGSDGDDKDARAESVEVKSDADRSTVYQVANHPCHHRHHRLFEVIGHKEAKSQTVMQTGMTGMPAPTFGDPMSLTQDPRAPRRVRRNSPAAGQGARVVSLDAWRKARAARTTNAPARAGYVGATTVRQNASTREQVLARPDRLGRALAWCAFAKATGTNPFDPKGLHGRA